MVLDMFTRVNLELTGTIRGNKKKGSLLHALDKTSTAMGGRLLRKYVEEPLVNKVKIDERLNVIQEIKDDFMLREDLNEILKKCIRYRKNMWKNCLWKSNIKGNDSP